MGRRSAAFTRLRASTRNADIEPPGPFVARTLTGRTWAWRGVYGTLLAGVSRHSTARRSEATDWEAHIVVGFLQKPAT